jgi:hypothetical protein
LPQNLSLKVLLEEPKEQVAMVKNSVFMVLANNFKTIRNGETQFTDQITIGRGIYNNRDFAERAVRRTAAISAFGEVFSRFERATF